MIYLQKKNYQFGISTCKTKENTLKFDITENQQIIVDKIIERYQNRNENVSESGKAYTNGISDNFLKNGVAKKIALTIFTKHVAD